MTRVVQSKKARIVYPKFRFLEQKLRFQESVQVLSVYIFARHIHICKKKTYFRDNKILIDKDFLIKLKIKY